MKNIKNLINQGLEFHKNGELEKALLTYDKIIQNGSKRHDVFHFAGLAAFDFGLSDKSIHYLKKSLELHPESNEVKHHLSQVLLSQKRYKEAIYFLDQIFFSEDSIFHVIPLLLQAITDSGDQHFVDNYFAITGHHIPQILLEELWNFYHFHHQIHLTQSILTALVELYPDNVLARDKFAQECIQEQRFEEAIEIYREGLLIHPDSWLFWHNLGSLWISRFNFYQALNCFKKALQLRPDDIHAKVSLINVLRDMGQLDEALRLSLEFSSSELEKVAANFYLCARAHPGYGSKELFELFSSIGSFCSDSKLLAIGGRTGNRKLRIAYISSEFTAHSSNPMYLSLLKNHDFNQYDFHLYSLVRQSDQMSESFKELPLHWHDISQWSAQQAAEQIESDEIDILIELATPGVTWSILSKRPALIQISGLAYTGTSGRAFIDYRLVDAFTTSVKDARWNSEKLFYLPNLVCWAPPQKPVSLPLKKIREKVHFGSGNDYFKLNDQVLAIWGDILKAIPESQLHLKCRQFDDPEMVQELYKRFKAFGIEPARLICQGYSSHAEHLLFYGSLDIVLDPFPYSGGMSTLEALWMGTPIVTLQQGTCVSAGLLKHLNLTEMIALNPQAYIQIAIKLALDREARKLYANELREILKRSKICDARAYAHSLEQAYESMYQMKFSQSNTL